jgi:hypothetical protein
MIAGQGLQILKLGKIVYSGGFVSGTSNIYILTDKGGTRTDYLKMQKSILSDYSAMLMNPSSALGKPQCLVQRGANQGKALIDNGKVFYGDFLGPLILRDNTSYYAAPFAVLVNKFDFGGNSSMGVVVFDNISKAFMYSGYNSKTAYLNKFSGTSNSGVNLQPNNMKATLLHLEKRAYGNSADIPSIYDAIAIMKDDATGERYLADFNFGLSEQAKVSIGRYSMEGLPDVNNVKYYAFGAGLNMNYYATNHRIYKYLYLNNNTASVIHTFSDDEEITMMKILKYEYEFNADPSFKSNLYKYSNKMMVVGTLDATGHGKLYAFTLDVITGDMTLVASYNGTESGGSRFGKIYDANLKDQ